MDASTKCVICHVYESSVSSLDGNLKVLCQFPPHVVWKIAILYRYYSRYLRFPVSWQSQSWPHDRKCCNGWPLVPSHLFLLQFLNLQRDFGVGFSCSQLDGKCRSEVVKYQSHKILQEGWYFFATSINKRSQKLIHARSTPRAHTSTKATQSWDVFIQTRSEVLEKITQMLGANQPNKKKNLKTQRITENELRIKNPFKSLDSDQRQWRMIVLLTGRLTFNSNDICKPWKVPDLLLTHIQGAHTHTLTHTHTHTHTHK